MELFMLLGTILSAVIGAVSNGISNKQNINNANQQLENQQEFAHQEAILANERGLQNYYETQSPEARVEQMKKAGLSVGLMYGGQGNGGVNTSPQATAPGANLPVMQSIMPNGLNDVFSNIKSLAESENIGEDTEKKKQEIENLKSTIEVNNATIEKIATENKLTEIMTSNSKLDGVLKQIEIDVQQATKETRIQTVNQQLKNLQEEGNKLLEEIKGLKIENEYKEQLQQATLNKMAAETVLIWKQVYKTEAETNLVKAQTALTNEQTKMSYAQRQYVWKQVEHYEETIAKINAETKLLEKQQGKLRQEKIQGLIEMMQQCTNIWTSLQNIQMEGIKTLW